MRAGVARVKRHLHRRLCDQHRAALLGVARVHHRRRVDVRGTFDRRLVERLLFRAVSDGKVRADRQAERPDHERRTRHWATGVGVWVCVRMRGLAGKMGLLLGRVLRRWLLVGQRLRVMRRRLVHRVRRMVLLGLLLTLKVPGMGQVRVWGACVR